jgi:hypothetical protein
MQKSALGQQNIVVTLYKCTNSACNNIGAPSPRYIVITVTLSFTYRFADPFFACHGRYKLVIIVGDEIGDVEFVIFGWIAQCLIKRTADALVANNPYGFIPDEITRLP